MRWLEHRIPPPVIGLLLALTMWKVAAFGPALPWADAQAGAGLPAHAPALLLALTGLGFDLAGLLAFRRARTTVNPLRPERSSALVSDGVYRLTRNPMYLGMALLLTAWALHLGAWLALAGPLLFIAYITRFQILPEERVMRDRFGEAFDRYAARTRRWL